MNSLFLKNFCVFYERKLLLLYFSLGLTGTVLKTRQLLDFYILCDMNLIVNGMIWFRFCIVISHFQLVCFRSASVNTLAVRFLCIMSVFE